MTPATAKHRVQSILEYCEGFVRFAQLRNDLQSLWHWQECWCLIFSQFFGSCTPARPSIRNSYPNTVDAAPASRPRWFVEKYSQPVRKVSRQMTVCLRDKNTGEYFSTNYDELECGHRIKARFNTDGTPPARHRWCKECPPKDQQMREAGVPGSHTVARHKATAAAFAVTGAVNTISRARRVSRRAA